MKKLLNISHDFEAYSDVDVKKVGAWAYSQHPSTEVISWAIKVEDEEPLLWLPGQPLPHAVKNATDYLWHAWNNFFEYCIWHHTLKLPSLPIENQSCTMALALALALPRSLGDCGKALGLPTELVKNPRGEELIQKLCKPNRKGERNRDPALLEEFYAYNKQDTVAEYAIKNKLRPLSAAERKIWALDFRMNIRGVPVDTELLKKGAEAYEGIKGPLKARLKARTGLDNPNSGPQFKGWLADKGYDLPNLQKPTLAKVIADCGDAELIKTIKWRSALARTPLTKFASTIGRLGNDNRYHGALGYHVATTGRWSSSGMNFQNLTHPTLTPEQVEQCIKAIKVGGAELLEMLYDDPVEAMSSCLRGMLCAPPGRRLIVADYSAIEARTLAWLAGQQDKIDVFKGHGKVYEHAASRIFNVAIEDVDKAQRAAAKVAELACGYQGAYRALLKMARGHGIDLAGIGKTLGFPTAEAFAKSIVSRWREASKRIQLLWYATERAALRAMQSPGNVVPVNDKGRFLKVPGWLLFQLPSRRQLAFFNPRLSEGEYGLQLSYWCVDPTTKKWQEKYTYGGDLVQSWTQATARDVMAAAMAPLEAAGYPNTLLVHDEIIAEVPEGHGYLEEMVAIMCDERHRPWANGLPVIAKGFEAQRYQDKD